MEVCRGNMYVLGAVYRRGMKWGYVGTCSSRGFFNGRLEITKRQIERGD